MIYGKVLKKNVCSQLIFSWLRFLSLPCPIAIHTKRPIDVSGIHPKTDFKKKKICKDEKRTE